MILSFELVVPEDIDFPTPATWTGFPDFSVHNIFFSTS